jgi:hypothetical protein
MCTVAAIIQLLGFMPPPGTVISLPAAQLAQYSTAKVTAANVCARRYGIKGRIVQ